MFKSIPKKDKEIVVAKVENMSMQRVEQTYTTTISKVRVKVRNIYIDTILDSSTKVNIITRSLVDKARLTIQTNLILVLKTILGDIRKFDRACEDIDISIGGITNV